MNRRSVLGAGLAAVLLAACAGGPRVAGPPSRSLAVPNADMPILAPAAVPGVPSTTSVLTAGELGKDAPVPGLAQRIASWGYLDGRQRTFQGESRLLTTVISRSLVFRSAGGAADYVGFVRAHAGAFFGTAVRVHGLIAQGRRGWVFLPAPCACHLANPVLVGVLHLGRSIVWLEINGPSATRSELVRLLDPARSAPATIAG